MGQRLESTGPVMMDRLRQRAPKIRYEGQVRSSREAPHASSTREIEIMKQALILMTALGLVIFANTGCSLLKDSEDRFIAWQELQKRGCLAFREQNWSEAEHAFALAIAEAREDNSHPAELALSTVKLADTYDATGKSSLAAKSYEVAAKIYGQLWLHSSEDDIASRNLAAFCFYRTAQNCQIEKNGTSRHPFIGAHLC